MSTKIVYQERKVFAPKATRIVLSYVVEEPIEALRKFYGEKSIIS